ncbi:MAG: type I methionyl aminopeptidase [Phycisphaerae bacterium]
MPGWFGSRGRIAAQAGRIELKSPRELELIRAAGHVVHAVLAQLRELAGPGLKTRALGEAADRIIGAAGGEALFRGVRTQSAAMPFPAAVCVSVNEEVVHGIPGERELRPGDVVSVDCGVRLRGYCADAATTIPIGPVSGDVRRLLEVTSAALELAIREMRPGRWWSEIAAQMQELVESSGFAVVREFVGHGIGREMHEEPKVPNYTDREQRKSDFELRPGLVIAVEPMVTMGTANVKHGDATGWPQVTRDGSWAAHFEHTLAVVEGGVAVLTDGRPGPATTTGA